MRRERIINKINKKEKDPVVVERCHEAIGETLGPVKEGTVAVLSKRQPSQGPRFASFKPRKARDIKGGSKALQGGHGHATRSRGSHELLQ